MDLPRIASDAAGMRKRSADERIHELAAPQHGVVTRAQLREAGLSRGAIEHRLSKGVLQPVHRGVYRTGPITARYQPEMAAVLACGPATALSDRTAAALVGMLPARQPEAPVDVTGPSTLRGPAGVRLHRRDLEDDEVTERHGLPLTTPPRTVLDLASGLGPCEMERALARATKRGIVTLDAVEAMLMRHPRRPGCRTLRALLEAAAGPALTRSEAEALFLALLRNYGVPRPRTNVVVCGFEVDFYWPDRGVVVEVDGFAYHSHRGAFENDRDRGLMLAGEGLTLIRVTWRQLQHEPEKVMGQLCLTLGMRAGWAERDRNGSRAADTVEDLRRG